MEPSNNIRPFRNNLSTQFNRLLNQPMTGGGGVPSNFELPVEIRERFKEFTEYFRGKKRRSQLQLNKDSLSSSFRGNSSNRSTAKPNRGALTSLLMTLLDKPVKNIGTILGTSLAETLGASPYNTRGMKLQAGAELGFPGFAKELNASKDIPVPYRLSEQKVKDDETTAVMRRRLQMLMNE